MYTSDNRISYSLSRLVLNRFAAIGSQYNGCGHLGDSQLGDNIFSAFHYTFLGLYQHIHFGVIRYTVALTIVPPHTSPTVLQPPKYCVGELRSNKVPKLPLTVLNSLPTLTQLRCIPAGELRTRKRRELAPAEVVRVRVRIEENQWSRRPSVIRAVRN